MKYPALSLCLVVTSVVAMFVAPSNGYARQFGPNLFIAGDGFTLEQAVSDAARQRTSQDAPQYDLLVLGKEIRRMRISNASSSVGDLIQQASRRGASVYVCVKDLEALGLTPTDLLPGIRAVRGYPPKIEVSRQSWEENLPQAPDQKMRAICSR